MIKQHGQREQLPKLLYTAPIKSTKYRNPVCITSEEWDRMKYSLNKNQIVETERQTRLANRLVLKLKSEELTKTWPDIPGNLHSLRQKKRAEKHKCEDKEKEQVSKEIKEYHDKVKEETMAQKRLQLMYQSQKGRLLTKGLLADAAAKERQLQIDFKKQMKEFDQMLEKAYSEAIVQDQKEYLKKECEKKENSKREMKKYYKDIDEQLEFQKELQARRDEIEKLDAEHLKKLDEVFRREKIQEKEQIKKNRQQTAAYYDKQCEEKKRIQQYEDELDRYENEIVQMYIKTKRETKQNHINFLQQQKKFRQDKQDAVADYIIKARQKIIDEDKSEEILARDVKISDDLRDKREKYKRDAFIAHVQESKDRRERRKNFWEKMKNQDKIEQIEEKLKTTEDAIQAKELKRQIDEVRNKWTKNTKECQYQQMVEKAKKRFREKIKDRMFAKHIEDAEENYEKDIDKMAKDLIEYAKQQGWPTNNLNHVRHLAKWSDWDHMFMQMGRANPVLSKTVWENRIKKYDDGEEKC